MVTEVRNKVLKKLLIKYERTDLLIRRKALVLMLSSFIMTIILFIMLVVRNENVAVSIEERIYQLLFLVGIVIIFSLVYHRWMTHATNTYLLWIIGYLVYVQEYFTMLLFIALPVFFILFRVTAIFRKQIYVLSGLSFIILIRQLVLENNRYNAGDITQELYLTYVLAGLFVLFICVFIYFLIGVAQKEIEKADQIMSDSTIDFVLKSQKRRVSDVENNISYVSVLLMAINDITVVNDELGFDLTEKLLKEMLTVIRETVRVDDYILRWEHDEFLIMLHNTPLSNSTIVAEKIRKAIEFHGFTDKKQRITVTICASQKNPDERIQDTVSRAQTGIKKAKVQKKNYVLIP